MNERVCECGHVWDEHDADSWCVVEDCPCEYFEPAPMPGDATLPPAPAPDAPAAREEDTQMLDSLERMLRRSRGGAPVEIFLAGLRHSPLSEATEFQAEVAVAGASPVSHKGESLRLALLRALTSVVPRAPVEGPRDE